MEIYMENRNLKGWLYLLPALLFLGAFMIYPLIDVFIYSFEDSRFNMYEILEKMPSLVQLIRK